MVPDGDGADGLGAYRAYGIPPHHAGGRVDDPKDRHYA